MGSATSNRSGPGMSSSRIRSSRTARVSPTRSKSRSRAAGSARVAAGVDHGERQVVADVRVDPGQRELQRPYAGMAPVLEQRAPAGRWAPPGRAASTAAR